MKILVVSDIHGNLPAIEGVLKKETDWDLCISLGDVVDYGPWSNECVELLDQTRDCIKLVGNHEQYFIYQNYCKTSSLSYEFYKFCLPSFNAVETIKKYAESIVLQNFTCQHTIRDEYIFPDTNLELEKNYFVGHSHRQFIYENNQCLLVNPGSVGQNRQFINRIDYAIWHPEKAQVELKNIIYDVSILINEMKKRDYPKNCIAYYERKPKI